MQLSDLFTLGRLTNNAALILPPEGDQHRSKISPLSASETLTQRRVRRNGVGSLHANVSVNAATDYMSCMFTGIFRVKTEMKRACRGQQGRESSWHRGKREDIKG